MKRSQPQIWQKGEGTRIITDPVGSDYSSQFAPFPSLEADIITLSHEHPDHNATSEVNGSPGILRLVDLKTPIKIGALEILGYPSKHVSNMGIIRFSFLRQEI